MTYFCNKEGDMETTIKISARELNLSWLNKIKTLFEGVEQFEITIRPVPDALPNAKEDQESYVSRVNNAILNLETGKDTITLSKDEYDQLVLRLKQLK